MRGIDTFFRHRFLAASWHGSLISVFRMEMVVYVSPEFGGAMKPRADANEDTVVKPFWTVIPSGSAAIGNDVIVTIRTIRGCPNVHADADLSRCVGGGNRDADSSNCG